MNKTDTLYRAFTEFRRQLDQSRECGLEQDAIASAGNDADIIQTERAACTIDEDWIVAIEKGLEYVEKAIAQGRQFILSFGETVPIEKVKRVSKNTIEHLAKHSDLITKEPKDDDLMPDKLYIVERLSDFAVYENRFLYVLLVYLKDFTSFRHSKILEIINAYHCRMSMDKAVVTSKRKLLFRLEMTDERRDDEYLKKNNKLQPLIERIEIILKLIGRLLETELMREVSKVPMIKPPIIKTNVLKMNPDFKGAMELYDYIRSYEKPGYTVEMQLEQLSPFPDDIAGEISKSVMLTAFLTYKGGLKLEKYLQVAYDEEEDRRRLQADRELKERLSQIKRHLEEMGGDPTEYIMLLENRNKALESDSLQLSYAKQEIVRLTDRVDELTQQVQKLSIALEQKINEIIDIKAAHQQEIAELKAAHQQEIDELNAAHAQEVTELKTAHAQEITELKTVHAQEVSELKTTHQQQLLELRTEHERREAQLIASHNDEILQLGQAHQQQILEIRGQYEDELLAMRTAHQQERERHSRQLEQIQTDFDARNGALQQALDEKTVQLDRTSGELSELREQKTFSDAQLLALRKQSGLIGDDEDFSHQATFDELEEQYKVFKQFFKVEWKKTKKSIRKSILTTQQDDDTNRGAQ